MKQNKKLHLENIRLSTTALKIIVKRFLERPDLPVNKLLLPASYNNLPDLQKTEQEKDQQPDDLPARMMTAKGASAASASLDLCTLRLHFSELLSHLSRSGAGYKTQSASTTQLCASFSSTLQLIKATILTIDSFDRSTEALPTTSQLRKRCAALLTVLLGFSPCCSSCSCCCCNFSPPQHHCHHHHHHPLRGLSTRRIVIAFIRKSLSLLRLDINLSSKEEGKEKKEATPSQVDAMSTLLCSVLSLEKVLLQGGHTGGDAEDEDDEEDSDIDEHVYEEIHGQLTDLLEAVKVSSESTATHETMSSTTTATTTAIHSTRQQVVLATEWLLSHCHLFDGEDKADSKTLIKAKLLRPTLPVKLSADGLMVRSDCPTPYTVSSEFIITSGVYYYEAILLTGGSMRLGWANRDSAALEVSGKLLGDDEHSIGYNGNTRSIHHGEDGESVTLEEIDCWKEGDVVGALIDVQKCKTIYYLNGMPIYYRINGDFGGRHIVAAATLTQYQQIYFNFGQHPWRYTPNNGQLSFANFHSEADGNARIYRIQEPTVVTIRREFVHFEDEIQSELDLVVTRWLTKRTSCLVLPELLRNPEFIKYEQGILRLSQSMINLQNDSCVSVKEDLYYYYDKLFFVYFIESNVSKINILAKFLRMIDPIISSSLPSFHWIIHRNLCLILLILLEHCKYAMKQDISDAILAYLLTIIEQCKCPETVLYALVGVELRVVNIIQFDLKPALRSRIMDVLTIIATEKPDFIPSISGKSTYRYQVAFCARWILEKIFIPSNLLTYFPLKLPPVKLSLDRLCVRAESMQQYQYVRSSYAFLSGTYFYETTLLTGGLLRIGWSSKSSRLEEYKKLGDDRQSIGYNGYDRWIWHGKPVALRNLPRWQAGDVVGCLLDTHQKLVVFYLNGHAIELESLDFQTQFSPPYFAAAYLFPHQQCSFNFGQEPFKFPPAKIEHQNFHSATAGDVTRYRLAYLSTKRELWHQFELEDSQLVFDEWILELVDRVSERYHDEEYFNVTLLEKFASLMDLDCGRLRLYHSIIRLLALKGDAQLDILVGWIEHFSTPKIHQWRDNELVSLVNSFIEVPLMGDTFNDAKRRNIVIVLFLMIRTSLVYLQQRSVHPEDFFVECYHFISQTLLQLYSVDKWTMLFAVNCLQIFARFEVNRAHLMVEESLIKRLFELSQFYEQTSVAELYENFDFLSYQIGFCAHLCLENLATKTATNETLFEIKFNSLSACRFTARGDSCESANFRSPYSFLTGSYYYEVVLLTSGSMKIGWATTEFSQEKFFVCLDLYRRYLWHNGKQIEMKHLPSWKVGDVLGCFVNVKKSKFVFYLNGSKLPLKTKFPRTAQFYSKPYFAATYLASHQQVVFNFGQVPFKWPPKGVQFGTFCTAVKMVWTC